LTVLSSLLGSLGGCALPCRVWPSQPAKPKLVDALGIEPDWPAWNSLRPAAVLMVTVAPSSMIDWVNETPVGACAKTYLSVSFTEVGVLCVGGGSVSIP